MNNENACNLFVTNNFSLCTSNSTRSRVHLPLVVFVIEVAIPAMKVWVAAILQSQHSEAAAMPITQVLSLTMSALLKQEMACGYVAEDMSPKVRSTE